MVERGKAEGLSEDDRARLHRAHQRLRLASQSLEGLMATERLPGVARWAPAPAPPGALEAGRGELQQAYEELREILGRLLD